MCRSSAGGGAAVRRWSWFLGVLLVLVAAVSAAVTVDQVPGQRVVAIGDIHGNAQALAEALELTGVVDGEGHWVAGNTILVQMGDLLDRGPGVRQALDTLMALEHEAWDVGGMVVVVLGNHEALNILGIDEHVDPGAYAAFVDELSEQRRQQGYERFQQFLVQRARHLGLEPPRFDEETENRWYAEHPPGCLEYREAMSPRGRYGAWLRQRPAMARVGNTLFVHGSIGAAVADASIDEVNQTLHRELAAFDELKAFMVEQGMVLADASIHRMVKAVEREVAALKAAGGNVDRRRVAGLEQLRPIENWGEWLFVTEHGPLWSRDAARWDDEERSDEMSAVLEHFGVRRMVVGHTGQSSGLVTARFGHTVWLIDTKMYELPDEGSLAALEIVDGAVTAVYRDRRVQMAGPDDVPSWSYRLLDVDGKPLPFTTDDEVLDFLRSAEVVSIKDVGRGVTNPKKLVLEADGVRAHAIFRDVNVDKKNVSRAHRKFYLYFRDYYGFEVAAYELSRMLGLDRVPPAVLRKVDGQPGSVQIWLEDMIMDVDRRDLDLAAPEIARWNNQRQMLDLFDNLIGNSDRNLGNVLIDRGWNLWYIDHSRCFVTAKAPLYPERITHCERGMWQALQSLADDEIQQRLGPYLSPFEIETLITRRDALIRHIRGLIAEHGEAAVLFDVPGPNHAPVQWPER